MKTNITMSKPTLLIILFLFAFRFASAQLSPEKITVRLQEIDEYILSEEYKEALLDIKELNKNGYDNANLQYKAGFCYLKTTDGKEKALPLLKEAVKNISKNYKNEDTEEKSAPVEALLYLGDAFRFGNNFDEAINAYRKYAEEAGVGNIAAQQVSQQKIRECHIAKVLRKKPLELKWEDPGNIINEGIANLNPVVSADGNTMIFTRKMKFYDAIYYTKNLNGAWIEPINITTQVGSDGEFYPTALSADGKKLLLSTYEVLSGQDIYESTFNGTKWSKYKKLDEGVNSKFAEINASYTPDGNTIIFASNRDNGFGGFDIYKSERRGDGTWSHALNLGAAVNTGKDEKNPRLLNNGNLLLFSSEGHLTMGGFDLFYIDYPVESSSKARNFGFPLNTVSDDLSFYPVLNQNAGFVAKNTPESKGETDIYKVSYTSLSNFTDKKVKTLLEISGISNNDTLSLFLLDASVKDTISEEKHTADSGVTEYSLYPGDFVLVARKQNSEETSAGFTVSEDAKDENIQVPLSLAFRPVTIPVGETVAKTNTSVEIRNIYFAFNNFELDSKYNSFLDSLAGWLTKNPGVAVAVTGYADALGIRSYNEMLSKNRAEQVRKYLLHTGISAKRVNMIAAGSTSFIARNSNPDGTDSPEGRQYNRRVEIDLKNLPENTVIEKKAELPDNLKL